MTDTAARADVLRDAMYAAATGDETLIECAYTEDVTGWSPVMEVVSRDDLVGDLRGRAGAFSDIDLTLDPVEAVGDKLIAEWRVAATHTGAWPWTTTWWWSRPAAVWSWGACSSPSSRATASATSASTGTRSS